ncbi:MAG: hypothetical protein IKQ55_01080 [Kiritimatiellae bacterium]|nr:hypothetical protein [Kiritimatiellia bacterium]
MHRLIFAIASLSALIFACRLATADQLQHRKVSSTRLIYTRGENRIDFYSYMMCRFVDNDSFEYMRTHVKTGDVIIFENGTCLKIGEELYVYNGETNMVQNNISSCIIKDTNIIYGAFIPWFK